MAKLEQSITINAPVEKVFNYVQDANNFLEWMASMTNVRDITGEGVGSKFKWTYKMIGVPFNGESEVKELVPDQRLVIQSSGGVASTWTYTFKEENDQTEINLGIEYTIPVPILGKMGEKLVLGRNERELEISLLNIKERMEN